MPELRDIEVSFTDINEDNLRMVSQLCQQDIDENGLKIQIYATTDRREAFRGAKYIICCVRVGMLEAFRLDVEIPLKYGVDQCVGDTLCAGGVFYGQRGIAAMEGICRDIREVAAPGALLLNYANPNAMITWYCNTYGGVNTVGLCHGVQGGHRLIAKARILGVHESIEEVALLRFVGQIDTPEMLRRLTSYEHWVPRVTDPIDGVLAEDSEAELDALLEGGFLTETEVDQILAAHE